MLDNLSIVNFRCDFVPAILPSFQTSITQLRTFSITYSKFETKPAPIPFLKNAYIVSKRIFRRQTSTFPGTAYRPAHRRGGRVQRRGGGGGPQRVGLIYIRKSGTRFDTSAIYDYLIIEI